MKLVTFKYQQERARMGVVEGGRVYGVSWPDTMIEVINRGITPSLTSEHYALDEVALLPPVRPGKIIAVGRNYAEHAAELGNELPQRPLLFSKYATSTVGHGAAIVWQAAVTQQVDWEGELAVVIGRPARHVSEAQAYEHVFGYTIANDVSARDLQSSEGQWTRAKAMDTFCPLGPHIVTRDEIADPHNLRITTEVSGQRMQDGHTGDMIFSIPYLIAYCSQAFTLEPGDVLLTGTPAGVGRAMQPPRFLQDGDIVSVSIEGIGTLTNPCRVEG